MESEIKGITKEESTLLQGVAILLMLHHHFFNDLTVYDGGLDFWNGDAVMRIAWFGKICVGLFAFVSGYGLCRIFERKEEDDFFISLRNAYSVCVTQIIKLFLRYWVILIAFMGLLFAIGKRSFDVREFFENVFCVQYSYNGAHWYVGQYVKMLAVLPLFYGLFWRGEKRVKKPKMIFYVVLSLIGIALVMAALLNSGFRENCMGFVRWMRPAFVLTLLSGYLVAKLGLMEKVSSALASQKRVIYVLLGTVLCGIVIFFRVMLADSPAYATLDFLFVPVFAAGVILMGRGISPVRGVFVKLGEISAYVWLTHLFIYELSKNWIMTCVRSHVLFFLVELFLCLMTGFACKWIENGICAMRGKK